jgi:SagB-type dehydrogenase family enzyme
MSQPSSHDPLTDDLLFSPSEIYHENSKLRLHDTRLYEWIHFINSSSPDIRHIVSKPLTGLRGYPFVALTRETRGVRLSLEEAIVGRRSERSFSGAPLSLNSLSQILFLADGVTGRQETSDGSVWELRAAPSGGGLFPIELYCIVRNVEHLERGLYVYDPRRHGLYELRRADLAAPLSQSLPSMETAIHDTAAAIMLVAVMPRIRFKYGERAYRFALLEIGHIAQNLLLAAQAEGASAVPIGGFLDDAANDVVGVDGLNEAVQYVVLIGQQNR